MQTRVIYRSPLGNPDRKYRQDRFIISTFCAKTGKLRRGLELCKEAGFNMVEFGWVKPEDSYQCITACEEVGLDGLFQNWNFFGGFQTSEGSKEIDLEKLKEYIAYTRKFRHFAGYYVWDEPYEDAPIRTAARQVAMMEELDPDRLPFTVAIPSYNQKWTWKNGLFERYLRTYTETISPAVLSLDYYPFCKDYDSLYPNQLDDCELFLDLALLRRLALEKGIPLWFYFQTQDSPADYGYVDFPPEKVRVQLYNAMIHGVVGLQHYNVFNGGLTREGDPGPLYDFLQDINHRAWQLGKTLMALHSVGLFHSPEVLRGRTDFDAYRQTLADSKILAGKELPFRCSAGEFEDAQENRYLFILNRDYLTDRSFELDLQKEFRVYTVSQEDGAQSLTWDRAKKIKVSLRPGDAVLLRFQDAAEEPFLIDYVLKK